MHSEPYAFLSSPVYGLEEVRQRIHGLELPDGRSIWVDEIDRPRAIATVDPFDTIDDLFALVRKSSAFLVLLSKGRYGTSIKVGGPHAHVSFWEAELFYAVLSGKPVQVFVLDDFAPDPKLSSLLSILDFALPRESWSGPHSPSSVAGSVHEYLLAQLNDERTLGAPRSVQSRLTESFYTHRGLDAVGGAAATEELRFLDGHLYDPTVEPNLDVVKRLLATVTRLQDEEKRLSRLWLVFRELSGSTIENPKNADLLPYWNTFFGAWASAGSWYGLHAHLHLGVLSALTVQARVRERMVSLASREWQDEPTLYPGGALASSRYSIARKIGRRKLKNRLLQAATRDLERELSEGSGDPANLYAIRGSIYRQMGRYLAGVRDYEEVFRLRKLSNASEGKLGEALSELGFGYLFCLRPFKGRDLLRDGVKLLSHGDSRTGFLIRAKRKLAIAYALTGSLRMARQEREEAQHLAREHGIYDQIR